MKKISNIIILTTIILFTLISSVFATQNYWETGPITSLMWVFNNVFIFFGVAFIIGPIISCITFVMPILLMSRNKKLVMRFKKITKPGKIILFSLMTLLIHIPIIILYIKFSLYMAINIILSILLISIYLIFIRISMVYANMWIASLIGNHIKKTTKIIPFIPIILDTIYGLLLTISLKISQIYDNYVLTSISLVIVLLMSLPGTGIFLYLLFTKDKSLTTTEEKTAVSSIENETKTTIPEITTELKAEDKTFASSIKTETKNEEK